MKAYLSSIPLLLCLLLFGCSKNEPTIDLLALELFEKMPHRLKAERSVSTNKADVFSLADGQLTVNGKGWGYIETQDSYENFELTAEYRWGTETHGNRKPKARDAGIFIHCHDRYGDWPKGVEIQLIEGGSGNINILDGKNELMAEAKVTQVGDNPAHTQFTPTEDKTTEIKGKVIKVYCDYRSAEWADKKGFRGANDIEKTVGKWNQLKITSQGHRVQVHLNGKLVNEVEQLPFSGGKIAIQSEEAEWSLRKLQLTLK